MDYTKMKKIIAFVLFIVVVISAFFVLLNSDNDGRLRNVRILKIRNESLLPILDSIIIHERKCAYYTPELIFSIHSRIVNDTTTEYNIGSIGSWLVDFGDNQCYKGCFEHRGHWFVVEGQALDSTVFKRTSEKKDFVFYEPDGETENGEIILFLIDDDTYSFWIYDYSDNVFIFKEMYDPYCNCGIM